MSENNIPVSVLIVDDDPAKLTALTAALEGMDIGIVTAASGEEALRKLMAQDFAAVLLDVNMPDMDGFETATMIRSRPKSEHLPILFITAERLTDDARLKGYELGAVDYILSPVLPQILRSKVAVFADLYRLREQIYRDNADLLKKNEQIERQLDELSRFQRLSIGRELRMKELVEENAALRHPLADGSAGDIPVTSGSLEEPLDAAEQPITTQPIEEGQRSALLFMLEDLESAHKKIEQAHQEWMAALDVVEDPIFLHDQQLRILRCNKAFQQLAGIPFKQIIGQPYYEIFPKTDAPLPCGLQVMEKTEAAIAEEEVLVGEATYRSRAFPVHDEHGVYLDSMHILEDITERKRAEASLQESEAKYRLLIESLQEGIWMIDKDANTSFVNLRMAQMLGYSVEEMSGRHLFSFMDEHGKEIASQNLERRKQGIKEQHDFELLRKDGSRIYTSMATSPILDEAGNYAGALAGVTDITERKQVEQQLSRRLCHRDIMERITQISLNSASIEDMLEGVLDEMLTIFNADRAYFLHPCDLGAPSWSVPMERTRPEWPGAFAHGMVIPMTPEAIEVFRELLASTQPLPYGPAASRCIPAVVAEQFSIRSQIQMALRLRVGSPWVIGLHHCAQAHAYNEDDLLIFKEIGERVADALSSMIILKNLRESEERYRTIIENSNDMIWTLAPDGSFTFINQQAAEVTGRRIEDWLGKTFEPLVLEEDLPMVLELYGKIMSGEKVHYEVRGKKADGGLLTLSVNASPIFKDGKVSGTISFARDITEQKRAEAEIQHANRGLAALIAVNRNLVHATNEGELLQTICRAIVEQRGYRMAWVGYAQHDKDKSIRIMARAGHGEGYLDAMQLTWAESERGMGPTGLAIRSGATQLCQDIANDPLYLPWRDAAIERGYAASIALPLLNESNTVFGILHVYSAVVNDFTSGEVVLLEEMAGDLAFGVHSLQIRHERDLAQDKVRQQVVQLQDSLEDTVRAMAGLVEMRDPYTAGHQARVADLAAAIARQLGLSDEEVHAIHLAGIVHDLGKIKIPAEILSKPGRITDLEFSLIKVHPQAGYDILKCIDFPWPIAQMVLQHHERLDGTGYPQGLKGEAILLEARILSVADVVEAIYSHRPYRPGLGIDVALAEITKQRGTHYDPQVVGACLTLFREQGYSFKEGGGLSLPDGNDNAGDRGQLSPQP